MTPLPAPPNAGGKTAGEPLPSLPTALTSPTGPTATATSRPSQTTRLYPWLLVLSTSIAALFCLMYITKPVIQSSSAPLAVPTAPTAPTAPTVPTVPPAVPTVPPAAPTAATGTPPLLLPPSDHLPGESKPPPAGLKPPASGPRHDLAGLPPSSIFEETNLRIQHVLTAETPGGRIARIDLDVPVLYQSRSLRWTPADVAEARGLLVKLMDYQEKSQRLRTEGSELLDAWNRLLDRSLPAADLRADSPSLPANQLEAADAVRPAGLITTESIQIQPAGK